MGHPIMIQAEDNERIEALKRRAGFKTKVAVLRAGLQLLEEETQKRERIAQWKRAVVLVTKSSARVNKEFQSYSRLKRL